MAIDYDFSAAERIIDYFSSPVDEKIREIVTHPAYKLVFEHSKRFSSTPLIEKMLIQSMRSHSTVFGFKDISERLSVLTTMIDYLKRNVKKMDDEYAPLASAYLPKSYKSEVKVFFLVGGYNGIALNDQVAINIDWKEFRNDPFEIFLYLPHELFHIGFAHYQQLPDFTTMKTKQDLKTIIMRITMDEGLATLVPYKKRISLNALSDYDYSVLIDDHALKEKIKQFETIMQTLDTDGPLINGLMGEILGQCSGDRLFYIVGCYMGLRIEEEFGRDKLIELVEDSPEVFFRVFNEIKQRNSTKSVQDG